MSVLPITVPTKRLASAIASTDSSFKLNNILGWDSSALTAGFFGTQAYVIFRNETNTLMEIMEIDPATIASTSITILNRGLSFDGAGVVTAANKLSWPANETLVELGSHFPNLFNQMVDIPRAQTITGIKTFAAGAIPKVIDAPVGNTDVANKLYVDSHGSLPTNYNQNIIAGFAGEALTKGWAVYLKVSDGKWYGTAASASATSEGVLLGIAQATASLGAAVNILVGGVDQTQTGLTPGALYYLSDTKGLISSSAGTKSVVIGQCDTLATELVLSQRFTHVPTAGEKAALVGDNISIAVGAGNKYVTQTGAQVGAEQYILDSSVSANTITLTYSPAIAAYTTGMRIYFKLANSVTGATTVNVNGLGTKNLYKIVGGTAVPLVSGDLLINQMVEAEYDGTQFQILSNPASLNRVAVNVLNFTIANNTNEQTIFTQSIPGGRLGTNGAIRLRLSCSVMTVASGGGTAIFRFKYGVTTVATLTITNNGSSTTGLAGMIEGLLLANGATNSQAGSLFVTLGAPTIVAAGVQQYSVVYNVVGTAAIDSTAAQNLVLSVQFSAAPGTNGVFDHYIVELIS